MVYIFIYIRNIILRCSQQLLESIIIIIIIIITIIIIIIINMTRKQHKVHFDLKEKQKLMIFW